MGIAGIRAAAIKGDDCAYRDAVIQCLMQSRGGRLVISVEGRRMNSNGTREELAQIKAEMVQEVVMPRLASGIPELKGEYWGSDGRGADLGKAWDAGDGDFKGVF